jgi:hypothetical protein
MRQKKKEKIEEGLRNWNERKIKMYQLQRQEWRKEYRKMKAKRKQSEGKQKDEEDNKISHRQINKTF